MTKLLPLAMAALGLMASIAYFAIGDWRRGLYWLLASGISVVVTL
jgi:hypothetical protein